MSRLWFDPSADIVKHDPPRKPLDPSRPIRRAPIVVAEELEERQYLGGLASIDASYQTGHVLVVSALSSWLAAGDIITIDGVVAWNRVHNKPDDYLRQFVVTSPAKAGECIINIYPPICDRSHYRTVVSLPMNRAIIRRFEGCAA